VVVRVIQVHTVEARITHHSAFGVCSPVSLAIGFLVLWFFTFLFGSPRGLFGYHTTIMEATQSN
jgi:hypothetical protein